MDPNKLTEKSQEAIVAARTRATERGHAEIEVEHLASALLAQEGGTTGSLIRALGGPPARPRPPAAPALARLPRVSGGNVQVGASARLLRVLNQAQREMEALT